MSQKSFLNTTFIMAWVTGLAMLGACSGSGSQSGESPGSQTKPAASKDASCGDEMSAPKVAPMAAAMRAMLQQAEAMRSYLISDSAGNGAKPEWTPMPFEKQTPTDSNVVTVDFLNKAANYHRAFDHVGRVATPDHFNALVAQCVQCHESNCPGPIKRINRLRIDI
jgi:hypothetical protein